ncbi:hypothetical protein GJ496_005210 [Pomphorhynchus laevis]|nr:hypothetical protein GJ496_005210 [Pomphorhynchus laevis]
MRQSVINSSADLLLRAVRSALNVIIQRVDLSEKLTGQEYITGSSTALTNTTDHSLCPSNQESENADVFDDNMSPKMTEQSLRNICVKHSQYTVPELNDILYLHYIGFRKIENLDKYTGVKCLWLSHNGISKIENLSNLPLLTCLYLQNNCINSINGIKHIRSLKVLNLSHNFIRHVTDEISQLSHLISLDISHNYISGGLKFLSDCKNMTTLDISNNKIDRIDEFFQITNLQQVKVLNLMGNSVLGMIGNYRLNMVLDMMNLTYLDDMPVFYRERLSAEAW